MDRRCLLIESHKLALLKRDGPALRLRAHGSSLQWFPLRRLDRVLMIGLPDIGFDALVHTAKEGVPVTFLSAQGSVLAQLSHPAALPNPLRHWLEALQNEPALAQSYQHWLDNQLRIAYGMLGFFGSCLKDARQEVEKALAKLARKQKRGRMPGEARVWFATLLTTQIQSRARRLGMSSTSLQLQRLVDDLLPAGVALAMSGLLQTLPLNLTLSGAALARFYERHLADDLDDWINRAIYTLASQLEYTAMLHRSEGRA